MSKQTSSFSSSSFSYSSSSSGSNGQTTGQRELHTSHTDPSGTTIRTSRQQLGEPAIEQTRRYDTSGRELLGGGTSADRRIEDVTDEEQAKRDREYEERIEEEYAKREGGA